MATETQRDWTHYERLGVAEDASPEEIRRAHRRLAMELHSDRKGGPYEKLFEGLTKDLNVARDTLLDPARRSRYDAGLAAERLEAKRSGSGEPSPRPAGKGGRSRASARPGGSSPGAGPKAGPKSRGSGERSGAGRGPGDGPGPGPSDPKAKRGGDRSKAGEGRRGTEAGKTGGGASRSRAAGEAGEAPPRPPANAVAAFLGAFARVEEHPRAHMLGASAFVAAAYLLALVAGWGMGGPAAGLAVLLGVPVVGLLAPGVLRRSGRPRAAYLARALWAGPLALCVLSLGLQLVPGVDGTGALGVLEVLVNGAFVAAGLYPPLWMLVLGRKLAGRVPFGGPARG